MSFSLRCIVRQVFLGLVVGSSVGMISGCSKSGDPAHAGPPGGGMPAMPVTVLEVHATQVPTQVEVMGQVEGLKETEVRAQIGGVLLERLYTEGSVVQAGQILFRIDPSQYTIALDEAIVKAEQANRDVLRLQGLAAQKAVSQKEYDDALSTQMLAQAALQRAELNLSYTAVRAPISGVSRPAKRSVGNLVSPTSDGNLLTSIDQINPVLVSFSLSPQEIAQLPSGKMTPASIKNIELLLADGTAYAHPGKLHFLTHTLDRALGTQRLSAQFDNPDNNLLPGQFVRVRLLTGQRTGVFLLPQSAVIQGEQEPAVFVVDAAQKVTPRPVKTANWYGQQWVISSGLHEGDRVIIDNLIKLRPGMSVVPHLATDKPIAGSAR